MNLSPKIFFFPKTHPLQQKSRPDLSTFRRYIVSSSKTIDKSSLNLKRRERERERDVDFYGAGVGIAPPSQREVVVSWMIRSSQLKNVVGTVDHERCMRTKERRRRKRRFVVVGKVESCWRQSGIFFRYTTCTWACEATYQVVQLFYQQHDETDIEKSESIRKPFGRREFVQSGIQEC